MHPRVVLGSIRTQGVIWDRHLGQLWRSYLYGSGIHCVYSARARGYRARALNIDPTSPTCSSGTLGGDPLCSLNVAPVHSNTAPDCFGLHPESSQVLRLRTEGVRCHSWASHLGMLAYAQTRGKGLSSTAPAHRMCTQCLRFQTLSLFVCIHRPYLLLVVAICCYSPSLFVALCCY